MPDQSDLPDIDEDRLKALEDTRRIVVKLGTNTLSDPDGLPDPHLLESLAKQIKQLNVDGKQVLIISSGAIGCGQSVLHVGERPQDVHLQQAYAAIGQHRLMAAWDKALHKERLRTAQILVTKHTFDNRRAYLHLRHCLEALLKLGVVPIINENDVVSTAEIGDSFGDNDHLGSLVAAKVEADLYAILSDVPGLFDGPPGKDGIQVVTRVAKIDDKILRLAGKKAGRGGSGGMRSKLESTRILTEAGTPVIIAYGREPDILGRILAGEPLGTWFDAVGHQTGRERWLMAAEPKGRIVIDKGAAEALQDGYHLLPAGVTAVEGDFPVESPVEIIHDGTVLARAVCLFSSRDLEACKGQQSEDVREYLGVEGSVNVTRKGRIALLEERA